MTMTQQEMINNQHHKCEDIKDKIAHLQNEYNIQLAYLEHMSKTLGLSATVGNV
jgi:hypothetical protein